MGMTPVLFHADYITKFVYMNFSFSFVLDCQRIVCSLLIIIL